MRINCCPVCESDEIYIFMEIPEMPIYCNRLWSTREKALSACRGDIRLGSCNNCGHIFNTAFDPKLMVYDQQYENSLHFSTRFQSYAEALAQRLISDYDIRNKDVIDIGCGKGDFLALLCDLGNNRGLGFDPSYENNRVITDIADHLHVIHDYFSERYSQYPGDLICCRHVLEHIENPRAFLESVRRTIGNRTESVVFFEVPDVMYTLKDMGIWDLIYEHCGYYSQSSLSYLFKTCGFEVLKLIPSFGGQFLCIDAKPDDGAGRSAEPTSMEKNDFQHYIKAFLDKYLSKRDYWEYELDRMSKSGRKTIIWGGGSKGITFLNVLQNSKQVEYVVDINPHKHGRYVPGTGQRIVAPDFLAEFKPDVILIMNPNYLSEIQHKADQLNLTPQFLVV